MLIAVALTGCGKQALTTPVLRDRATDACQTATKLELAIPPPRRPDATLAFLRRGIVVLDHEYARLHGLDAGGKAAPVFHQALAGLQAELGTLRTAAAELSRGGDPLSTFKTLQTRLGPLVESENGAWSKLEIPACQST